MNHFDYKKTVFTVGVFDKVTSDDEFKKIVFDSIGRYKKCDWGDTCKEDSESNNYALNNEERILAVYIYRKGTPDETKIWIITEWDRSATTILFPSEY